MAYGPTDSNFVNPQDNDADVDHADGGSDEGDNEGDNEDEDDDAGAVRILGLLRGKRPIL